MYFQYHPYAVILLFSALITIGTTFIALRGKAPGSRVIGWILFFMGVWSAFYAIQWTNISTEAKITAIRLMMLGVLATPTLFLVFSLQFTQNERWLTWKNIVLLSALPLIFLSLIWTNEYHHWIYSSITGQDGSIFPLHYARGPFYLLDTIYSYALLGGGFLILYYGSLRSGRLFRVQFRLVVLACIIPLLANLYNELYNPNINKLDLTPIMFGLTAVIFAFSTLRSGFMDLVPVARTHLIENMQDGVLVFDATNRVVDFNPVLTKILGVSHTPTLGKHASDILGDWFEHWETFFGGTDSQTEMRSPNDPTRFLDLRMTPLHDKDNHLTGRLLIFRDITERKDVERKLRNVNRRLQSQLIEIGVLQSQLREQAIRDPLTNLFNRRYLEETLDRELARAARESYPLCIIMMDIDHFKQVNDTYGHEAGDVFLKALAEVVIRHSRRGDFVCRFGGEEFVLVMPNMTSRTAEQRAELLRESLNSLKVPYGKYTLMATFSMGIACYPANGDSRETLLRAADIAMYAAKNAGRDHIRSFDQIQMVGNN